MSNETPNKPKRGPTPPPQTPNRISRPLLGWVILIGLVLILMTLFHDLADPRMEISPDDFWTYANNKKLVETVVVKETKIEGTLAEDVAGLAKEDPHKFYVMYDYRAEANFDERLEKALAGSEAKRKYVFPKWWEGLLPNLLVLGLVIFAIWFLMFRRMAASGGVGGGFLGSFGRSRHRVTNKEQSGVTFNDVAGIEEAKEEVREIIEFLKNPRKFRRLGGRIPRGVLLVGEPGCGKTLLARAIAGEADVPFFNISGSDFVEMFVGVGASRVRDLFKQAKDSSPCIIFLDEIDAIGRRRGVGFNGGGHDEREQTLNAILVEMDGFGTSDQVIVIAATNRMDVLDPALTRPGRFDRQIDVPLPDLKGRFEILKIYAARIQCGPDVDMHRMARGTPMFSGADLEALVNEAAIAATMADKEHVEQADFEEARDKVRWGRTRKSRVIDEQEKKTTAYHEAGHALVQTLTPAADPLHKVSIIPRGRMGGATFSLPEKDRYLYTRTYCNALLSVCFGGRLAEEMFCNDVSSGAASDIVQATGIARKMVLDWGMSDKIGLISYAASPERAMLPPELSRKEYSDKTAEMIDQEVKDIIDAAYSRTRELLEANRDKLDTLAQTLLKYETLNAREVRDVLDGKGLDKPTIGDLLDIEHAKANGDAPAPPTDDDDIQPASSDTEGDPLSATPEPQ